jgi:hypothetical protein
MLQENQDARHTRPRLSLTRTLTQRKMSKETNSSRSKSIAISTTRSAHSRSNEKNRVSLLDLSHLFMVQSRVQLTRVVLPVDPSRKSGAQ